MEIYGNFCIAMINESGGYLYNQLDPSKKNGEWFNTVITQVRRDWYNLVDPIRLAQNKQYLFGQQDLKHIKETFKDTKFKENTKWKSIDFMEAVLNSLIEELKKAPPKVGVKAVDPEAKNEKKRDINLLKTRKFVEQDISSVNAQVGLPGFKVDPDNFEGNVEVFDEMGFEETDPDDVNVFSKDFHRMWYEIGAESLLNNVLITNKFDDDTFRRLVIDILCARVACFTKYVDQITGEIKLQYVYPETVKGIFGLEPDGKDDVARGYEDVKTVGQWMQMVGNSFDFERDWLQLLMAINYYPNGRKYTGFIRGNRRYSICENEEMREALKLAGEGYEDMEWSTVYKYKIYIGYIEFMSPDCTGTWIRSHSNKDFVRRISFDYTLDKEQSKEYYKESFYQQQWYRSWFLATGTMNQYIYNFGKVYYQNIEGANDEYAAGNCVFYREEGGSVMDGAQIFMDMGNFAFYKFLWILSKAKPEEDVYVFEELLEVAKALKKEYPQGQNNGAIPAFENIVSKTIEYQQENVVRLRSYPRIDGRPIGQLPPLEGKRNGVDPIAGVLQGIIQWVEYMITSKYGINPMRMGANPPSRESFNTEQQTLNASMNSTGYIYRMIQRVKEELATRVLLTAQDIIRYKESVPYKWIKTMIGDNALERLSSIGKIAAHRMGIYCFDHNYVAARQRVLQAADMSFAKGNITFGQWYMIAQTDDFRKAAALLDHLERKKDKLLRRQAVEDQERLRAMQQEKYAQDKDLINTKGGFDIGVADRQAAGQVQSANIQANSRIQTKQIQVDAEPEKNQSRADAQKEVLTTKENLQRQAPFETPATGQGEGQ